MCFPLCCPCTAKLDEVKAYNPAGIVLSGAPWSVYDKDAPPADVGVFELGVPVLGICYGLQFMVHTLGGKVRPAEKREYGHAEVDVISASVCFREWPENWQCGCRTATKLSNFLRASN